MSHKASKTCESRSVSWDVTWSCPQPVTGTTKLCSTVPDSEVEQTDWLYRIGCEEEGSAVWKICFLLTSSCAMKLRLIQMKSSRNLKVGRGLVQWLQACAQVTRGSSPCGLLARDEILLLLLECQLCACARCLPPGTGCWGCLSVEVDQVNSRSLGAQLLGVLSRAETIRGV